MRQPIPEPQLTQAQTMRASYFSTTIVSRPLCLGYRRKMRMSGWRKVEMEARRVLTYRFRRRGVEDKIGGGGGSRTPVRKALRHEAYMLSSIPFFSPAALRMSK